jgi:hypothetical protein
MDALDPSELVLILAGAGLGIVCFTFIHQQSGRRDGEARKMRLALQRAVARRILAGLSAVSRSEFERLLRAHRRGEAVELLRTVAGLGAGEAEAAAQLCQSELDGRRR